MIMAFSMVLFVSIILAASEAFTFTKSHKRNDCY